MQLKFDPITGISFIPPQSNIIGNPVLGGIAARVLYIDNSGNLAESSNLQFDGNWLGVGGSPTGQSNLYVLFNQDNASSNFNFILQNLSVNAGAQCRTMYTISSDTGTPPNRGMVLFCGGSVGGDSGIQDNEGRNLSFWTGFGAGSSRRLNIDSNGNVAVTSGQFTTNDCIQINEAGNSNQSVFYDINTNQMLTMDPSTSEVSTLNNTLDDGSGNSFFGALATFANIVDSGLSASQLVKTNGSKQLVSATAGTDFGFGVTSAILTGKTAAVASVVTTTSPNDATNHIYTVGGSIVVTAISVNTITLQVTYTDETSTTRTQSFFGEGLTTAAVSTTGGFNFPPMTIISKPNTAITILTTVVGVGSETYDVAGFIQRIS